MLVKKLPKIHPVKCRKAASSSCEQGGIFNRVNFKKLKGLIPVITQDHKTNKVLMLGFMNKDALKKTLKEGKVTYWSRTRKKLWTKGETSGSFQLVKEIWLDCDNDTLLIKVKQMGNVCHTGNRTCFFQKIYAKKQK